MRDNATFKVHTEGAGVGELQVKISGPGGVEISVKIKKFDAHTFQCMYVPQVDGLREGLHQLLPIMAAGVILPRGGSH